MSEPKNILWEKEAAERNIRAADEYLHLTFSKADADMAADKFRKHKDSIEYFKAKDILRASELKLLPATDEEVAEKLKKVKAGEPINPALLVRDKHKLYIADGYHRVCAAYHIDEASDVACILVHV
ncbi:MAG TPA: hypothetical protein VFA55_02490 [Candidatus Kapabacteria bacterium]|nr:hypothetical protein [Candidatus Kapabacteria bacterium]